MDPFDTSFDLDHPFLRRVVQSFLKAAGIGAIQSISRQAYFSAVEGATVDPGAIPDLSGGEKKHRLPDLQGKHCSKSVKALVNNSWRETFQWGLAAGVYSGLTYVSEEGGGSNDWETRVVAGAMAGAALGLISDDPSQERVMQCAITGAALSTAATLLSKML